MTKQVYQLVLAGCISILLAACQGQNADDLVTESEDSLPTPTQRQDTSIETIDETFVAGSASESSDLLTLFTFSTPQVEVESIETAEVVSSVDGMILELDTSGSNGVRPDVTVLVKNDSVFTVDHGASELTLVRHFSNDICDILPKEIVESSTAGAGSSLIETLSVRHAESVYVITAHKEGSDSACLDAQASRFYYELPLNFQFDSSPVDDSTTKELSVVTEAEVKAKLIFGWVKQGEEPDAKYALNHGYLGYSFTQRELVFFNASREPVWVQKRELETYASVLVEGESTPFYLLDVKALDEYQYLIQLNQDIFIVDAGTDIFAKAQSDVGSVLSDRVYKLDDRQAGIVPAETYFDNDDLVIIDQGKVLTYAYQKNLVTPEDQLHQYQVFDRVALSDHERTLFSKRTFSQFDYNSCADDYTSCIDAHDIGAAGWQFISDCESELGCVIEESVVDLCDTQEEFDQNQSGKEICSPEYYRHLDELDEQDNNAEFVGFIQYLASFINDYHVSILENSLLISASMLEKDVIVQYFYKQPLSAPKSLRERVLFGSETDLFGLEHFVENNDLYINALIPSSVRSNECYKGYGRVECDLGTQEEGAVDKCTAKDLSLGLCYSSFTEFESTAIFCTSDQVNNRTCLEGNIDSSDLRVENDGENAKWVRFLDLSGQSDDRQAMFVLKSVQPDLPEQQVLEEGVLLNPSLHLVDGGNYVDDAENIIGDAVGELGDQVETVLGGILFQQADSAEPMLEGFLDVLKNDIDYSSSESGLISHHLKYALVNTLSSENSAVPVRRAPFLGATVFSRVNTSSKDFTVAE